MFSVNHFIVSQTNPHVVPFLNLKRRLGTAGAVAESEFKHRQAWPGREQAAVAGPTQRRCWPLLPPPRCCWSSPLLQQQGLHAEWRRVPLAPACRCRQLVEVLPSWAPSKWLRVFSQQWEGDVTIVLPHTFLQLYKAVVNPSNAGGPPGLRSHGSTPALWCRPAAARAPPAGSSCWPSGGFSFDATPQGLWASFPPACTPLVPAPRPPPRRPGAGCAPGRAVHVDQAERDPVQLRHRGHAGRVHPAGGWGWAWGGAKAAERVGTKSQKSQR